MNELIKRKIEEAGHRVKFRSYPTSDTINAFNLNVRKDRKGEYFTIDIREDVEASVLDIEGDHLLLMFKEIFESRPGVITDIKKSKALIGHDERQLFVAAIPERYPASTVHAAKEALKPMQVLDVEKGVKKKDKHKRRTPARKRQGDFFFIPVNNVDEENSIIHKNEPISRGSGASHICEMLIRTGGQDRHFHRKILRDYPNGMSDKTYKQFLSDKPEAARWIGWSIRRGGNIRVYVKGYVKHHEHKTLVLRGWHEVLSNTENLSNWGQNLAFID